MTRLPSPDFDPRIAHWLESDPDEAPSAVLDTILAAIPSIPQRHRSQQVQRPSGMRRVAFAVAAALTAVVVGGTLLVLNRTTVIVGELVPTYSGSISSSDSLVPTDSPRAPASRQFTTVTFASREYGYSIRVPIGWKYRPAVKGALSGGFNFKGEGHVPPGDDWYAPRLGTLFAAGYEGIAVYATESRDAAPGTGSATPDPSSPTQCPEDDQACVETITIGGGRGEIHWDLNQGTAEAFAIRDGVRFTFLTLAGRQPSARDQFRSILRSVVFG